MRLSQFEQIHLFQELPDIYLVRRFYVDSLIFISSAKYLVLLLSGTIPLLSLSSPTRLRGITARGLLGVDQSGDALLGPFAAFLGHFRAFWRGQG